MPLPFYRVDAFANERFAGNPAAVCVLSGPREESWMHAVAQEMNLPATAFVYADGDRFAVRWLMPAFEISLCGHGAIATCHVLREEGLVRETEPITLDSFYRGAIEATYDGSWIWLDLAADPTEDVEPPFGLLDTLGVDAIRVSRSAHDFIVEVASPSAVEAAAPDFAAMGELEARAVAVTARGDDCDFVSRVFEPSLGVSEDQATGSVHCVLGPYWAARLDRCELTARQVSARGGVFRLHIQGDRVRLGGQAVTVAKGSLLDEEA